MIKLTLAAVVVLLVAIFSPSFVSAAPENNEPRTITITKEYLFVKEYTTAIIIPRPFPSYEFFRKWYYEHLPLVKVQDGFNCTDYSKELKIIAAWDGWDLDACPLDRQGKVLDDYKVRDTAGEPHIGTWTITEGVYYYAESNPGEYKAVRICPAKH